MTRPVKADSKVGKDRDRINAGKYAPWQVARALKSEKVTLCWEIGVLKGIVDDGKNPGTVRLAALAKLEQLRLTVADIRVSDRFYKRAGMGQKAKREQKMRAEVLREADENFDPLVGTSAPETPVLSEYDHSDALVEADGGSYSVTQFSMNDVVDGAASR